MLKLSKILLVIVHEQPRELFGLAGDPAECPARADGSVTRRGSGVVVRDTQFGFGSSTVVRGFYESVGPSVNADQDQQTAKTTGCCLQELL